MIFDAVVGNPPYQKNISDIGKNTSLSKQLFPLFMQNCFLLNAHYVSFITPSRWFTGTAQDKSFLRLRQFIQKNDHMQIIVHFKNEKEIFKSVEIKGGVSYFLYNNCYRGETEFVVCENNSREINLRPLFTNGLDVIIADSKALPILSKVIAKDFISLKTITTGRNPFGIIGKASVLEVLSVAENSSELCELRCKSNIIRFIKPNVIKKNISLFNSYKVFISKSAGSPYSDKKVIGIAYVGGTRTACTDSLFTIGAFDNEIEAHNLCLYLQTQFLRYLVSILKTSQNVTQLVYGYVPMQNFSTHSDIDWTKPVYDIDQQLFFKYQLTDHDIAIIESSVKPMD